jgi:phage-related protein
MGEGGGFKLEFYLAPDGRDVVSDWADRLSPWHRRALLAALREVLARSGLAVCGTQYGKQLGGGLFELRIRHASEVRLALRVFCPAYGHREVLVLGGYDKAADPSPRRQSREIELARARLADWKRRRLNLH